MLPIAGRIGINEPLIEVDSMLSPRRSAQLGLLAACTLILASLALIGWSAIVLPHPREVGQPAPAFTLQDTDGHPFSFPPTDHKIQVLYFWSMRQPSCHATNKAMVAVAARLDPRHVRFLGIHPPTPDSADAVAVQSVLAGLKFPTLMDVNGEVSRLYHAADLPVVCVIGPAGLVRCLGPISANEQDETKITPRRLESIVQELRHESAAGPDSTQALATPPGQPK